MDTSWADRATATKIGCKWEPWTREERAVKLASYGLRDGSSQTAPVFDR